MEFASVIAIVALVFAGLQWYTNHKRFKHELFDRRYKVYDATSRFLGRLGAHRKMRSEDEMEFLTETAGTRFIFSPLEEKYIERILRIGLDLNLAGEESRHEDKNAIMAKIRDEMSQMNQVFGSYLKL
ncbi:hypothetical protein [Cellvibrio sp. PSBB006]|uniref:hypothetical protein n=1 Tax=Cellvibrio sp. PSBB006 TaxID=1987723 RepID=UPI000B3B7979|nr:hypothetical protein [Cellvibrio sp. PSBB006]ARU26965.1 hypothetical protein CBR65_05680 [Cellvibrio sp. PSBB006]